MPFNGQSSCYRLRSASMGEPLILVALFLWGLFIVWTGWILK